MNDAFWQKIILGFLAVAGRLGLVALVFAIVFALTNIAGFIPLQSTVYAVNTTQEFILGGVLGDNILIQTFESDHDFDRVGIKIATYTRKNKGQLNLRILDWETGEELAEEVFDTKDLLDNSFNEFKLSKVIESNGQPLALEVSGVAEVPLETIGIACSYQDRYKPGVLIISEVETKGDMVFYIAGDETVSQAGTIAIALGLAILLVAGVILAMIFMRKRSGGVA